MPAEDPEWLEDEIRQVDLHGASINESASDSQGDRSSIDLDASQGLCDCNSLSHCVYQEMGYSMSEIIMFYSTPEISDDIFRTLFEIIEKYSSL